MKKARIITAALVTAAAVTLSTAFTGALGSGIASSAPSGLDEVRAATARYHSVEQADRDGFSGEHEPCVTSPGGAMGVHYVNGPRIGDPRVNALEPEILLYVPNAKGKPVLAGVEYLVIDADQNLDTDDDRPSLFGRPFDGPMSGHGPGMPVHYDLHAWVWADNPSGTYAPFNPALSCP